jgi:hypothetical protein
MLKIETALQVLQNGFPPDWITAYEQTNANDDEGFIVALGAKFLNISRSVYFFINLSVIEGEYIEHQERVSKAIEDLRQTLSQISATETESGEPIQSILYDQIENAFAIYLTSSLNRYKYLIDRVNRKVDTSITSAPILNIYQDRLSRLEKMGSLPDLPIRKEALLFSENLIIARIDHTLKVDEDDLRRLLLSLNLLDKSKDFHPAIAGLLKQKCCFLIYKIDYRNRQKNSDRSYNYVIDFVDRSIDIDESNFQYFLEFKRNLNSHYSYDVNHIQTRRKTVQKFYEKLNGGKKIDFKDYHAVVKHYKDDRQNSEQLRNFIEMIDEKYEKTKNGKFIKFDRYSYDICYTYFKNNYFSHRLEEKNVSVEDWYKEFLEVNAVQEKLSLKNFFIYEKSIAFLDNILSTELLQLAPNLELLKKALSYYDEMIQRFSECLHWCEEKSHMAFQLPFEECCQKITITNLNDEEQRIRYFLASSFVLPIDFKDLKERVDVYKSSALKYRTIEGIQSYLVQDKEELKLLKEKAEGSDKRSIEIISIFSAIIMFVAGDIQILQNVRNIQDAFRFIFLFGYALGGFVLLIWFITRTEKLSLFKLTIFHYFIMAFYVIGFLIAYSIVRG